METISRQEAVELIKNSGGKLLTVGFNKRSNGAVRRLNCRRGVSKGVTGEGKKFDDATYGLLTVFAMNGDPSRGGFRSIPEEGIFEVKHRGRVFTVKG